jgi:hypothetical protein
VSLDLGFKGTVQRDFHSVFLHLWIGLGLVKDRSWFEHFSEAPTILDRRKFASHAQGEIVSEKLYFLEKFTNLLAVFRYPDWPKTMLETRCCCYKTVLENYF